MTMLMDLAQPLAPADRSVFLQSVVGELGGCDPGDGQVFRVAREIQCRYVGSFERKEPGKYGRG